MSVLTTSKCSEWRRCWHVKGPVCPGLRLITSKAVSRVERQIQFYWITSACRAQCKLCVAIPVLQMKVCPVPRSKRVSCVGLYFLVPFELVGGEKSVLCLRLKNWQFFNVLFVKTLQKLRSVSKFLDEKMYLEHLGLCHSSAVLYSTAHFWKERLRVLP